MTSADATRDEMTSGPPLARALSVAIVFLMIASSLIVLSTGARAASILEVDDNNVDPNWYAVGGHYRNITYAINAAVNGDTILVHGGTYNETVTVGKEVVIRGNGSDPSAKIVQKPGSNVITVTANNVKIIGLTIKNGEKGVTINGAGNFQVVGCNLTGNKNGLYVNGGPGLLANNNVDNNTNEGIYSFQGFGLQLENNSVLGNGKEGVLLSNSGSVTMRHNNMTGNLYDISVVGSSSSNYDQDIDDSNTVSGRKVIYLRHETGPLNVPIDAGYVGLFECSDITVQGLTISKVGQGVLVTSSNGIKVKGVIIQDCQVGIKASDNNNDRMEQVLVNGSTDYGIRIDGGSGNQIVNSTIIGTKSLTFGNNIYVYSSTGNTITGCTVKGSKGIGIQFVESNGCKVITTTVSDTQAAAISLMRSTDCIIDNNTVTNNLDGIVVGVEGTSSSGATVSGNLVDNAPGPGNGITLIDYPSTKVVNNRLNGNVIGINVTGSPSSSSKNTGIVIQNNVVQDSAREGISINDYVTETQIIGNVISVEGGSYYGIRLGAQTTSSLVYDNSITSVRNAYDGGSLNRWNISKTAGTNVLGGPNKGGNYYSNYTDAIDVDQDGICDSPYNLTGVSKVDNLPLFKVATPSDPVGFVAVAGDSRIVLGWSAPSSNGGWTITGYRLYRGTTPGNVAIYRNLGNVTDFTDTNVTNGNFTYYEVAALNGIGEGSHAAAWSTPSAVASAPQAIVHTIGNGFVNLTWAAPVNNGGSDITQYLIYRGSTPSLALIDQVPGSQLYYNDTSVTNRVNYTYQISAKNSGGEGPRSTPVSATPNWPPSMPIINITQPSSGYLKVDMVTVQWDMNDSISGIAYCEIRIDGLVWTDLSLATTFTYSNLTQGQHVVEVRAWNNAGYSNNATKVFVIDSVVPEIKWTDPNGTEAPVTFNLTIQFSEVMASVNASIDGQKMVVTIVGVEARCLIPFEVALDTTYHVSVNGSDLAGNEMTGSFDYKTTDKVKVTGRVIDSDNVVVADALVNIGGNVTTTDPYGNFTMYIRPGTYPILIEKDGLDPFIGNVTASSTGNDLGVFLTAGSQNKGDGTNWFMLLGGLAGLIAGIVLLVFVLRMRKQTKKGEEKPPIQ